MTKKADQNLKIPSVLGTCVILTALLSLFLWIFVPDMKAVSGRTMKFNTSLAMLICGAILVGVDRKLIKQKTQRALAAIVLFIGIYTMLEYVINVPGNIDQFFVTDYPAQESNLYPGRMSPLAAGLFILTGLGFFLKSFPQLEAAGFGFVHPDLFLLFHLSHWLHLRRKNILPVW